MITGLFRNNTDDEGAEDLRDGLIQACGGAIVTP
jgi:hypothetical protein